MLSSSIIASSLASRVKEQARMAAEKSYYTELLLGSSQKLQTIRTEWDCLRLTAEQLSRMFDRPVIYALNDADKELDFRIEPADEHTLLEKLSTEEIGVAQMGAEKQQARRRHHEYASGLKMAVSFRAGHPRR